MPAPFVVTPANAPSPLKIVGEQITVLASGAQTGSYEIFLQQGPESSGPPPHNHPWDESFYVIKGEIAFGIDDSETTALPGTLVHLPAGTTHWFRFGKGGGEMISMTSREGACANVHRSRSRDFAGQTRSRETCRSCSAARIRSYAAAKVIGASLELFGFKITRTGEAEEILGGRVAMLKFRIVAFLVLFSQFLEADQCWFP